MTTVLVIGGVRSGKSAYAESLLRGRDEVTYLAPGHSPGDDADWRDRVAAHRARRPAAWATREGGDIPATIATTPAGHAMLLDCLGTWLARLVDHADAWQDSAAARAVAHAQADALATALSECRSDVVVVSNEVGLGVVPATSSGRLFRDLLGYTNRVIADACDHVALVVAGRVLDLSDAPGLDQAPDFGLRPGAEDAPTATRSTGHGTHRALQTRAATGVPAERKSRSNAPRSATTDGPPGSVAYSQVDLGSFLDQGIDLWEDAGLTGFGGTPSEDGSPEGGSPERRSPERRSPDSRSPHPVAPVYDSSEDRFPDGGPPAHHGRRP